MAGHDRRDLEEEAWCRFVEAGHFDVADRWSAVLDWCGFYVPFSATGKSRTGKANRLGVANAGRGGIIWDVAVNFGRIIVPGSLKAATDRDVTTAPFIVKALAAGGQPVLTYLLRWGQGGDLEMRRIDAARVVREIAEGEVWKVRDDKRSYGTLTEVEGGEFSSQTGDKFTVACERVPGGYTWNGKQWPFKVVRTYPRLRIEWAKVPDHLYYDEKWVPFSPEVPANLWGG